MSLFEEFPRELIRFYRVVHEITTSHAKNFREAAERCDLNPPDVVKAIDVLETQTKRQLFVKPSTGTGRAHRGPARTTKLTPEGEELYAALEPTMDRLIVQCEEFVISRPQVVRVAAHQALVEHDLLPKLKFAPSLLARNVRLIAYNQPTARIIDMLRRWRIDWGIVSGPAEDFEKEYGDLASLGLRYDTYIRFPTVLLMPQDPGALGISINPKDLNLRDIAKGPLVLVRDYAKFRRRIDMVFRNIPTHVRLELDSGSSVVAAVKNNLGMAILHEVTVPAEMRVDSHMIPLPDELFGHNELGFLQVEERTLSDASKNLLAYLKQTRA